MHRHWIQLLLIVEIWTIVSCKSYYSIVAPGTIKSNRKYTVCVTLHDAYQPCTIRVGVLGTPLLNISQEVNLKPFQTKAINLMVPMLKADHSYKLIAEGVSGFYFRNTTELNVDEKDGLNIFIQTDRSVYKPGDLVQFRVVLLDEHIKPIKLVEPIKVLILDSHDIRVKQFKDIRLNKGIFTGTLLLSDQPNLGTWKICATISGKYDLTRWKLFKVEKYFLPKFSIHMEAVHDFALEDKILKATIYGQYTYGKYVEGKVDAKIRTPEIYSTEILQQQSIDMKDLKVEVQFDLSPLVGSYKPFIILEVSFTEKHTNVSMKTSQTIALHDQKYEIVILENEIEFHNNEPHIIKSKVQYLNGTLVNDRETPVYMQHGSKRYESFMDDYGIAKFMFDHDSNGDYDFYYKNASKYFPNMATNYNMHEQALFCSLKLMEGKLKLGTVIQMEVLSSSNIPYFVYTIVGHSNIIHMEYVQLLENQKSHIFKITPSIEMVPKAFVHVHYIENGNLRYCDIALNFPHEFENQISVSIANSNVNPGQEVTLQIKAQPESRVGLLAVDLSAHLLGSNYDISSSDIFRTLLRDKSYTPWKLQNIGEQSGLITLTNAHFKHETVRNAIVLWPHQYDVMQETIRSKFPETWIFKDLDITDENTELSLKIPDTITTWLVTAFSVNEKTGFGMMDEPAEITVFQNFFISTNLPYSIKRGEIITIPVTIFNYYEKNLPTEIIMHNTDVKFKFILNDNSMSATPTMTKRINVPANSGRSVSFIIAAQKVGDINIHLTATTNIASDAIHQKLKVEPEGILKRHNQDVHLNLLSGKTMKYKLKADIPIDIVTDSEYLTLSIGGDALVTTLEYLNDLIQLPTGCGEQNMINFVPNVLVLDYLKIIGKLEKYPDLVKKAKQFIEIGYQKELTFRHDTGGYSVFGPPGTESTWLTAYVTRFFIKSQKYISIDLTTIEKGFEYLTDKQLSEGDFSNTGYLFNPAQQNRYGFTAFVLMSFLESRKYRKKYNHVIQKSLQFLSNNIDNVNDTYALSIMATTFQMAKNQEKATKILSILQAKAKNENNRKWWSGSNDVGQANDVEITSYVLMALLEMPNAGQLQIFQWLIEQRNKKGGFENSQDTAVALQALVKFSEKHNSLENTLLKVNYTAYDQQGQHVKQGTFGVDPDNVMILQEHELPISTRSLNFEVMGHGSSLLQFSYQYYQNINNHETIESLKQTAQLGHALNVKLSDKPLDNNTSNQESVTRHEKSFFITPIVKLSSDNNIDVEVCFQFQPKDILKHQQTNMVILEINLPTGFISYMENTQELLDEDFINRVELTNFDSTIIIYFNHLKANNKHCIQIEGERVHDVQKLKPSTIAMYDYYNSDLRDTVSYQIKL